MSLCATCHAGCCRTYVVPLTGADILRIMSKQQLSFWEFVVRWADPQGKIALKFAPHFHFRDDLQTPYVIALMQEESGQFPGTSRCKFLIEGEQSSQHPLGVSQCGIYGDRPSACRVFPTKLDREGELAVLCELPQQGPAGNHPIFRLCSRPWEPRDLDPIQQVQELVVAKYEMNFFFRLASAWNEQPGDWRAFPEFLQGVYGNRILPVGAEGQVESQPVPEPVVRFPRRAA